MADKGDKKQKRRAAKERKRQRRLEKATKERFEDEPARRVGFPGTGM